MSSYGHPGGHGRSIVSEAVGVRGGGPEYGRLEASPGRRRGDPTPRTRRDKWNTFKYKATNVLDFAFAVSDHYLWQSSSMTVDSVSKRKAIINTVFNKMHKDYFSVHNFSRKTVEVMSYDFPGVAYPYPHITVFDDLDQMEYPMMVMIILLRTVRMTLNSLIMKFFIRCSLFIWEPIKLNMHGWMKAGQLLVNGIFPPK